MNTLRLLAVPLTVLGLAAVQAVTAGPAQAAGPACLGDDLTYNACLSTAGTITLNEWKVTAGLDAYMSRANCETIVGNGGPYKAGLYADDPGSNDKKLADMPLDWVGCGDDGIGMELVGYFGHRLLNEDTDGADELYARISFFDSNSGVNYWKTYTTGVLSGDYAPRSVVDR